MKELYEYLSQKRDEMCAAKKSTVEIDVKHLFRLHQTVCFMMQIRNIVNFDEDSEKTLREVTRTGLYSR